ncbi:helix-turn-helix domain-containing protein [Pseudomonas stutzeri]|uniref:helix-turn-helix domain-containing protein n=1 Tax=Stutzerimonas stutzeri TaxID=316 RepID=UPI001F520DC8|nr:helix-turn-helix domain-containing protein [Stutzerimonas stutzeri]MCI0918559.1 helix-turn-helix domain-containing protein [Stutzerimonas stutzeri]
MKDRPSDSVIPVFKLYGAGLEWPTPDLLHCESIADRSRLHDWEIRPHRHADLTQLLYIRRGWAEVELEGVRTRIDEAAVQVVPPLCIHGFRFSERVEGYVLTLANPLLAQLETALDGQGAALGSAGLHRAGRDRRFLNTLFEAIDREYRTPAPARDLLLQSLVGVLAVWVGRQMLVGQAQRPSRAQELLAAFTDMVEKEFGTQRTVEGYAAQLDITPAYLNTLARRFTGHTAQGVLHQRLLLEAKRQLIYTAMSVSQISDGLGFSEPAYFSRFFKRLTGQSPKAFRASLNAISCEPPKSADSPLPLHRMPGSV